MLAVLVAAYGGSFTWTEGPIVISAGIVAGRVVARLAWRGRAIVLNRPGARSELVRAVRAFLRDRGTVILVIWLFQCLETYTGVIWQTSIDLYLWRADMARFGVEPTVWLSKHSTPLLTDYMALAYGSYFIAPMVLATLLLHCSLALLTLIYSHRFSDVVWPRYSRLWFRIALVVVPSLWISVASLRHHGFVDIVAGLIVGAVANWLAPILRMR